ncbi:MAG TPA: hypothetical protein VGP50_00855 [Stellaceae bacterium]|jgi:hypothetical protein|nr:hypothetical protein [Stellaceae bacterium]
MADCPRFGKFFRGCLFVGRYDSIAPTADVIAAMRSIVDSGQVEDEIADVLGALSSSIYVRDVCIRCGTTVERAKGVAASPPPLAAS